MDTAPALCALKIKEPIPQKLYKFTQKNVTLTIKSNKKVFKEFGELTFYKEGLAGPICLTLSSQINRINPAEVALSIDFKPALSFEQLDQRLIREIQNNKSENMYELIRKLLPGEIIDWFINISKIDPNRILVDLTKEEREYLLNKLKNFSLTYIGLDDIERATVTSGGVSIKEINPNAILLGETWADAGKLLNSNRFDSAMNYLFRKASIRFKPFSLKFI